MTQVRKFTVFPKCKNFRPFNKLWNKPTKLFVSSYPQGMRWDPQSQDSGNHHSGYLMPLQNIPTVPTLQINSHSPLHTPSLRPSRAHKLPSRASQSYLCYRQAARCPYTGLPAQLFHKHSPELSGGCTPTTAQLRPLPRQLQSSRTTVSLEAMQWQGCLSPGMQVSQEILTQEWSVPLKD